jgi:PPK2 family polyphosphate:nucleotide phosphotransferase
MTDSFRDLLRLDTREGSVAASQPTGLPTNATPGFDKGKKKGRKAIAELRPALVDLQERLYAAGRGGGANNSLLLVLQGMDTSGKGGVIEHVTGLVNPQGLNIASFKQPNAEEAQHDFLWRIRRRVPEAGQIGVFDRSHYEDVLIVRVHELAPRSTWAARYDSINNFEADLAERGVTLIKCFLHISPDEQRRRLLSRLEDPTKHWKYSPSDVDERGYWAHYAAAYDDALKRCNTDSAPWYVIPADHKWYRDLAISHLLLEHLHQINPAYPPADFDPEAEKLRLSVVSVTEPPEPELPRKPRRRAKSSRRAAKGTAAKRGSATRAGKTAGKSAGRQRAKKSAGRQPAKKATRKSSTANRNRTLTASRSRGRSHALKSAQQLG